MFETMRLLADPVACAACRTATGGRWSSSRLLLPRAVPLRVHPRPRRAVPVDRVRLTSIYGKGDGVVRLGARGRRGG
jgi:hypothetical protein